MFLVPPLSQHGQERGQKTGIKMPFEIFSRATDPVVFDAQMFKLEDTRTPANKRCTLKKELIAAVPYIDVARRDRLFAYLEKNGSGKDKRRFDRKISPKRTGGPRS